MHEGKSSSRCDDKPVFEMPTLFQLNEIAVSDRVTLEGLTQFPFASPLAFQQTIATKGHVESDVREGGFCATLFRTARKSLILNGEMLERSIRHAWKSDRFTRADAQQTPPTHSRSTTLRNINTRRDVLVNHRVDRGFEGDVTQF